MSGGHVGYDGGAAFRGDKTDRVFPGSQIPPQTGNDVARGLPEPGSCDALTTDADPEPEPRSATPTQETTPSGWIIRHYDVSITGPQRFRTEVVHPWLGVQYSFYWSHW